MPIDPFLEPVLASLPPLPEITDFPAWRREGDAAADAMTQQLVLPGPAVRERREVTIETGTGTIDLAVYVPDLDGPLPVHLYIHGGGWIAGTIKHAFVDIIARERSVFAGCVVVTVDYRKAPEHQFPTGLNDCYAALTWIVEHADELNVRTDAVTVGGASAGANLAAALTLKARDEGGPRIAFQLLEVPALNLAADLPSREVYGRGYGLTVADMHRMVGYYLPTPADAENPYASPLLATDLAGLPPGHIMAAEFDPLRDDGEHYAARLNEAGVDATFTLGAGHIHNSPAFTKAMAAAAAWRDEAVDVLRKVNQTPAAERTR